MAWYFLMFSFFSGSAVWANEPPKALVERLFFYNDIYNFVGKPFPGPSFGNIQKLSQPFSSQCSHLNRIVVPFYFTGEKKSGRLRFDLVRAGTETVFSTEIAVGDLPLAIKIGTNDAMGVLHYVWLPPERDSDGISYSWELTSVEGDPATGVGVFFTNAKNFQVGSVWVDGKEAVRNFSAFYSFCRVEFDAGKIARVTGARLQREPVFLMVFSILVAGVVFFAFSRKEDAGS
jgi:hypothetical protein